MSEITIDQAMQSALQHHQAGRLADAESIYRQVLATNPNHPDALHLLGVIAHQTGHNDFALQLIQKSLSINPDSADARSNLGKIFTDEGRFNDAIASYEQAIHLKPEESSIHYNLGIAYRKKGDLENAIASSRKALCLRPDLAAAYCSLGQALGIQNKLDEAVAALQTAIAIDPNIAEAHFNLGNIFHNQKRFDEAIAAYHTALRLNPRAVEFHFNLGTALHYADRSAEAIAPFRAAISLDPTHQKARANLARVHLDCGDLQSAVAEYRTLIRADPTDAQSHFELGFAMLLNGDLPSGWNEYEWRWKTPSFPRNLDEYQAAVWNGEPLAGQSILLHAEQGFGDTLQFIRYLPLVTECSGRTGEIIVQCQPEVLRLLRNNFPKHRFISSADALPNVDWHCSLVSLPAIFQTSLQTIPVQVPYIQADLQAADTWRRRIDQHSRLKVGLVWSGSPVHRGDRRRSLFLSQFTKLAEVSDTQFFSLQKGEAAAQALRPPPGLKLIDWTSELSDFADTAALLANLDLLITCDTAVAHLAGAMGKPTWLLVPATPDWRWMLDRSDTPWYPTMRLFRQTKVGEWSDVVDRAAHELSLKSGL